MSQSSTQPGSPRSPRDGVVSVRTTPQGETVIHVAGALTVANRRELEQPVGDAIERGDRTVFVDLGATGYIDSAALGALVMLAKRLLARGAELRLANVNEDLHALFHLTALDTVFRIVAPELIPPSSPAV
jgi:anti-anti-sigma factor